jgi:hypothetical protein
MTTTDPKLKLVEKNLFWYTMPILDEIHQEFWGLLVLADRQDVNELVVSAFNFGRLSSCFAPLMYVGYPQRP